MASSRQTTFSSIAVTEHAGDRRCDGAVGYHGDGTPKRCNNTASIGIMRERTGVAEFYCRIHSKDTWVEMAGLDDE